ncbi:UNVERIFIED_CONTAM: hypothetical protein FKN15_065725 [Acipenser sinensis]
MKRSLDRMTEAGKLGMDDTEFSTSEETEEGGQARGLHNEIIDGIETAMSEDGNQVNEKSG